MNLPHNLKDEESRKTIEAMYFELLNRFGGDGESLKRLHPIKDMEIEEGNIEKLVS